MNANTRIQWLHKKISMNSYPNAQRLAERFGISHRQAQRDLDYLRRELEATCKKHGAHLVTPPISLCGDNGAMVAAAGYFEYLTGARADTSLNASANDDGN